MKRKWWKLASLLLALGLVAAACGDSDTTTTTLFCLLFVTNASWMAKVLPLWLEVRHLRLVGTHTTTELARVKLMLRDDG